MSNARMGNAAAPRRSDPTRTREAKADTLARRQARTLKGWSPTRFDVDALSNELHLAPVGVAR